MSGMRRIGWLLTGIGALVAIHLTMDMHASRAPRALRRNVLVPTAEKATSFEIARSDAPAMRLELADSWKIVAPCAARADQGAVLRLSDVLAYAPISEEMTDAELLRIGRMRKDFGLAEPQLAVTVGGPGDSKTRVSFGSVTPSGDGVYAAVGQVASVFIVPSNVFAAVSVGFEGFRRRRAFQIGLDDVQAFDIKNGPSGFLRIARTREKDSWMLEEPQEGAVSSVRVMEFLGALVKLEAQGFVWPIGASNEAETVSASLLAGYGIDAESSVAVGVKCADGVDRTVVFGRDAGKGLAYALIQEDSTVVTVPDAVLGLARRGVGAFVDSRLFSMESAAVRAVSLDDGRTVHLLSCNAEGVWRLDAPVSAPADQKTVVALVGRLLSLRTSDVVAEGVRVSVGTNAAPVCVSPKALFAEARVEDLRSKEVLKLEPRQVKRIVVTDVGKKPLSVAFDDDRDVWTVESAETVVLADAEAIGRFLAALHPLRAARVARLKVASSELGVFGLDKPFRTIAIDQTAEGSVRRNILIGDLADGGRYATLASSEAIFVLPSECVSNLLSPLAR